MTAVEMSFGATAGIGGTRFRLWAPSARSVALEVEGRPPLACDRDEQGWVDVFVPDVAAGARYRYRINDEVAVPDPASRWQPDDVEGHSVVCDPDAFAWRGAWRGRPWSEAVIYEAHVGTATLEGTYAALTAAIPDLAATGITALQLMPLANVPGRRNWGYDGVLLYAPEEAYGPPDELKTLVDTAHAHGVMVLLDVVYNHFGPSGNYLPLYAGPMFDDGTPTPWGAAIDVRSSHARPVREFIIQNALYWLTEFRFDGLRLDAVHAIVDKEDTHILKELAVRAREATEGRHVHLVLENERNDAALLPRAKDGTPPLYTAQWNDDVHHCWHVLLTGETGAYDGGCADDPIALLTRALATGFSYQGESYGPLGDEPRGTASGHLPPAAFVNFLQNHDQIGNRAFGDRLTTLAKPDKLAMATACTLLAPQTPMLFQGEEHGETNPFLFFCDFTDPALQQAVRDGRKREFSAFTQFRERLADLPDATDPKTFTRSKTRIGSGDETEVVRHLLTLRRAHVVPLLASGWRSSEGGQVDGVIDITWQFAAGALRLMMNLGESAADIGEPPMGDELVYASPGAEGPSLASWSLRFTRRSS